jgi:molecular chaperone DnaJ
LGDNSKRQTYDQFGVTGDEQEQFKQQQNMGGNPFGGFGGFGGGFGGKYNLNYSFLKGFGRQGGAGERIEDIFEDMEEFFGQASDKKASKKGKDIVVQLEINFMDAIHGVQKTVSFDRISVCSTCNGTKCRPGSSPTQCSTCGGTGKVFYKQGFMSIAMPCNSCNGEGSSIRNPCM